MERYIKEAKSPEVTLKFMKLKTSLMRELGNSFPSFRVQIGKLDFRFSVMNDEILQYWRSGREEGLSSLEKRYKSENMSDFEKIKAFLQKEYSLRKFDVD
jgi:hypothetical protein